MPDLEAINQEFEGVQVIGYSVDTAQNIRSFLTKVPVEFPILIGEPTAISLMRKLGNPGGGLPFSLVFAPDAELSYKIIGQVNTEELRAKLVEMGG
ncbi:TlpA family protein disulfide reductase [Oligella ureolytica]